MKRSIPILICTLFLFSCTRRVKTYHPNGKIATEYSLDNKGRKNGLFKVYNKNGILYRETEMMHDTISGFIKIYYESGELKELEHIEKVLYNISISDSDFNPKINKYSFVETFSYNKNGTLLGYQYITILKNEGNFFILVRYTNDSVDIMKGSPITSVLVAQDDKNDIKRVRITVKNIPKCVTNYYILDSTNKIIGRCVGCDNLNAKIDINKSYTLRVEYIDSTFHIKHSIDEPFGPNNQKRFPNGLVINWTRE